MNTFVLHGGSGFSPRYYEFVPVAFHVGFMSLCILDLYWDWRFYESDAGKAAIKSVQPRVPEATEQE